MKTRNVKVIFDTNVRISFLIGKRLAIIKRHIENGNIIIVVIEQILTELKIVTSTDKLKKYFLKNSVKELTELLEAIAENVIIEPTHFINRDPKAISYWT